MKRLLIRVFLCAWVWAVAGCVNIHMKHYFLELPERISGKTCLTYEFTLSQWDDFIEVDVRSDPKSDPLAEVPIRGNLKDPIKFYLNGSEIGCISMTKEEGHRRDLIFYYIRRSRKGEYGTQKISFCLDDTQLLFLKENLIKITCHKNGGGVDKTSQALFIPFHFREKIYPRVEKIQ